MARPASSCHRPHILSARAAIVLGLSASLFACQTRKAEPNSRLILSPCRLDDGALPARCGTLPVYENGVDGRQIELSVAVLPALSSRPLPDPLVLLAGGPGQAASDISHMVGQALSKIRRERDVVVVDQRGTGRSNALECDFDDPDAPLAERLRTDLDDGRIDACIAKLQTHADLRFYGTEYAIADLDAVREALGYERVNLWGGSYGTRVALAYMRAFPQRVRSAVLDGVAPLSLLLPADIPKDNDRALSLLFEHCREDAACDQAWPHLEDEFRRLLATLAESPIETVVPEPLTGAPTTVTITRDAFVRILGGLLYQAEATTLIPLTIARATQGDFRALVGQAEHLRTMSTGLVSVGMYYSVVCTEDRPFFTPDSLALAADGTFSGVAGGRELLRICDRWPKGQVSPDFRAPVVSDIPVLLLSGELDPVTPPRWAEDAGKTLSRSLHVVVPGTGHGTLGNACARSLVTRFVTQGSIDGLDSKCDSSSDRPPFFTTFAGPPL